MEEDTFDLNSIGEKTFNDATVYIGLTSTIDSAQELCQSYKENMEIIVDCKQLLLLYLLYFFPNVTVEIHFPVKTFARFTNVINFCVQAHKNIKEDSLLFEYYWNHFKKMLTVWIEKDDQNLKKYLTFNFIHNKSDDILFLSQTDIGKYLFIDIIIDKRYKELFDSESLTDDIIEMFSVIISLYDLNLTDIVSFRDAIVNDRIDYMQNIFDSLVDKINVRLLDLYYISVKKMYLKNICCYNKTFILYSILSMIYFVPEISLKIGSSENVDGWKNQFFNDDFNKKMEQS